MTIETRPPKKEPGFTETRDFERWMYNVFKKVGNSDTTLDDIDARSVVPLISRIYELERRISQTEKNFNARNSYIMKLEKRIDDLERSL